MLHDSSSPAASAIKGRRPGIYSGTTLAVIVVCLVVGGASLLFTGPLFALADRITRRPIPSDPVNSDPRLTDDEKLMYTLSHIGGNKAVAAIRTIVARKDERYVPVLIEMLEASESRNVVVGAGAHEHVSALESLTGEDFRKKAEITQTMTPHWIDWYQTTRLVPPEGFTGWKGRLLSRFDRRYQRLLRDGAPTTIRVEEIHFSGVRNHVRPSLHDPTVVSADEADFLAPGEPVYGICVNGRPRAYPSRVVQWHKAVNDFIDGTAISLLSCAQSTTINCYQTSDDSGGTYHLETTGLVFRGNELFFDKETTSLWCQITGECVFGAPSRKNAQLKAIPVVLSSWENWKEEHPTTHVAVPIPALEAVYDPPSIRSSSSMIEVGDVVTSVAENFNAAVDRRTRVYGLASQETDAAKAYPLATLVGAKVVNDAVGTTEVVLVAVDGPFIVERQRRRRRGGNSSSPGFLEGAEVRAYLRKRESFHAANDPEAVLDASGARWEITEEALIGPGGKQVPRIECVPSTWGGWQAFHPKSDIYQATR